MKKLSLGLIFFLGALFLLVLSAYQIAGYLTKEQMKEYATNVVNYYKWQHTLCLGIVTAYSLETVIDTSAQSETNYQKWIKGTVLKNRGAIINWMTAERMNEMLGYIDDAVTEAKMSLMGRDSLFEELKVKTNFYLDKLTKLQSTTPDKRQAIFAEVAKISPRTNAYHLQMALYENRSYPDLIKSQENLRILLAGAGITLEKKCDDFGDYLFTRYSRQYDYLFSLLRWTTYIDDGKITQTKITGWSEPTLKALIDDGVTFLNKTKKVIDAYEIK